MPSKVETKKNQKSVKKASTTKRNLTEGRTVITKGTARKATVENKTTRPSLSKGTIRQRTSSGESTRLVDKAPPTYEQITARAHELWVTEGCPDGRAEIHWHQAERELSLRS